MELTTAQLAERTGVPVGTLRVWRSRYGFPGVLASDGSRAHRRYEEADIAAVRRVAELRAQGLSMPAAIDRVRGTSSDAPKSIYAGLRERRPDLRPQVIEKQALLQLTRAIEDEHAAYGGGGLMLGSFQRVRHYRATEPRWLELARSASLAVAIADFSRMRTRASTFEVPVAPEDPLGREWALIVKSSSARACLAAWELPGRQPEADRHRRFEMIWSFDPAVVASARAVATTILERLAPDLAPRLNDSSDDEPPMHDLRFGADLAARAVSYLGAELARRA
ncbi:MAG TPA: DICT sensory domain-containing protein [Solirubrobacteraceae bacterium]|nr:DICT sensory domain-containing protein [Solirubrobacteraceae bacterium]